MDRSMKSIITPKFIAYLTLELIWRCIAWAIIPIMIGQAKRDTSGIIPYRGLKEAHQEIPRYKLPKWAKWAQCQDDVLPPCMYESKVYDDYVKNGWKWSTWVNLSFRNVGHGIMWNLGRPATGYFAVMTEKEKIDCGIYDNTYSLGKLQLKVGYTVFRDWYSTKTKDGFWAVPRITLRFKK